MILERASHSFAVLRGNAGCETEIVSVGVSILPTAAGRLKKRLRGCAAFSGMRTAQMRGCVETSEEWCWPWLGHHPWSFLAEGKTDDLC